MMVIDNKFEIGQFVYLLTDDEQAVRMVTHIKILPNSTLSYQLSCGYTASDHYEFEISETINVEMT